MKKSILIFFVFLFCAISTSAQGPIVTIKYISAENIYIDAGRLDGIKIGDNVIVVRDNLKIAELLVTYLSDGSAACKLVNKSKDIVEGDVVELLVTHKVGPEAKEKKTQRQRIVTEKPKVGPQKNKSRITGSLSGQWYHIEDLSPSKYNFDQPGFRVNLKMKNLFSDNYNFYVKTRTRYYHRSRPLSSRLPETEWRNRIYTLSFSYDNENALFNYKIGRIISNAFSGVGYLDGVLLQQNISLKSRFGVFAGTQPQWQYSKLQTSIQKYGGFYTFNIGDYQKRRFESTIAGVGEYHSGTVSREFIYIQNNFNNRKLYIYQSAEVDFNRDWKREKTNSDVSLTSIYINSSYKLTPKISAGLSYDNRKNYYTYEIQSVADSLFDDAMRYGFRGNLNFRLPWRMNMFSNFGLRKRKADVENTYSYSAGINKYSWTNLKLSTSLFLSGFSNYYSDGYHGSIRFGKSFSKGHTLNISYGTYLYKLKSLDEIRKNNWLRLNGSISLYKRFYLMEHYEYVWGNDYPGHRIFTELGYRF